MIAGLHMTVASIDNAACDDKEADEERDRYQQQNQDSRQTPKNERRKDECEDGNENHVNLLSRVCAGHYKSKGRCS